MFEYNYFDDTLIFIFFRTLDYIFVSPECNVESVGVYPSSDIDENKYETELSIPYCHGPFPNSLWPSDHSLIAATISYP